MSRGDQESAPTIAESSRIARIRGHWAVCGTSRRGALLDRGPAEDDVAILVIRHVV